MKKLHLLISITLFLMCSINSLAQEIFNLIETKYKNATLGKIMKVADAYFEEKEENEKREKSKIEPAKKNSSSEKVEEEQEGEYFQYKRWENEMLRHFTPNQIPTNYFASNFKIYHQYQKQQAKKKARINTNDFNGNWKLFGPSKTSGSALSGLGRVNVIAVDPDIASIIYVGTPAGGLWRSTDQGTTWTPLTDGMPQVGVSGIVIDPTSPIGNRKIYILTGDGDARNSICQGVFVSMDNGNTWMITGFPYGPYETQAYKLARNPGDGSLFVGSTQGLHRSTDGGLTWTLTNIPVMICDLEFNPNNSQIVYASSTGGKFFRSINSGATWTEITSGISPEESYQRASIAVSPASPNRVYFLSGNSKLYRSDDAGLTFPAKTTTPNLGGQTMYDIAIACSPINADIIIIGGQNGYRSTNAGTTWTNLAGIHVDYHELLYNGSILYAGTDGGIYKSTNDAVSNTFIGQGLAITQFYKIGGDPSNTNKMVGGTQDNGGNFIYKDSGILSEYMGGDATEAFLNPNQGSFGFSIVYGSTQFGKLYRVYAGAFSFLTPISGNGNWETPFCMDPNDQFKFYAGYKDVYRNNNEGNGVWTNLTNGQLGTDNCKNIAVAPSNSNVIYVCKQSENLYRSQDAGISWTQISNPLPSGITHCIIVHPKNPSTLWLATSSKVYKSTDAGITWVNISGTLPGLAANTLIYQNNSKNRIYLGMDVGIYYIDDDQSDWQPFSDGLPCTIIRDLDIDYGNNLLRAGTYGRGIWESPLICENAIPATISVAIGGTQFYSGTSLLSTAASVNQNSNVTFKGKDYVQITGSFVANSDQNVEFHAYVGDELCGQQTFAAPQPVTGTYIGPMPGLTGVITTEVGTFTENKNDFNMYPNPAKDLTNIEFVLTKTANVEITLYDLKGNKLSNSIPSANLKAGNYEINLNTGNLISGTYLLLLTIDGEWMQKKLEIVR